MAMKIMKSDEVILDKKQLHERIYFPLRIPEMEIPQQNLRIIKS